MIFSKDIQTHAAHIMSDNSFKAKIMLCVNCSNKLEMCDLHVISSRVITCTLKPGKVNVKIFQEFTKSRVNVWENLFRKTVYC